MAVSLEQFSAQLVASGLFSEPDLRAYLEKLPDADRPVDGEQLAKRLVKDKQISAYQAQMVYSGKGNSLTLGGYFVLDKLGQGGMGMVLKAEHRMMKRLVAIKVLSPAVIKTKELAQRFQREVEAAARLTHPNIVRAFDAGDNHGSPFLVLEFVPGTDLASLVKTKGPLSVEQAIDCIAQAARGLEFAHSKGVIHRDIKPANLLLDSRGTVKILDMGLARIDAPDVGTQANLTGTGAVMGTIDYMAPEQAVSTKSADARSDLYSLGISLWYLLTGRAAYQGDSLMARLLAHRDQPIPSLRAARDEVPESLDRLFRKLVAKDPAHRHQTATELLVDLQACQAQTGPGATGDTVVASDSSVFSTSVHQEEISTRNPAKTRVAPPLANTRNLTDSPSPSETWLPLDTGDTRRIRRLTDRQAPSTAWYRNRRVQIAGGVAALALMLGVVYVNSSSSRPPKKETAGPTRGQEVSQRSDRDPNQAAASPTGTPLPARAPFDATQALAHQEAWARYLGVPVEYTNRIGMKFRLIPPGEFEMGVPPDEVDEMVQTLLEDVYVKGDALARDVIRSGAPRHTVKLTQPFYLGTREVTQAEYLQMTGWNASCFSKNSRRKDLSVRIEGMETGQHPVEDVTWHEAVDFCNVLSESQGFTPPDRGAGTPAALATPCYRLPTEAEWEFACRAGTTTRFWTGDDTAGLADAAWSARTAGFMTHPVGERRPNPFGLFDMHGNVSEFVEDRWDPTWYAEFAEEPAVDPFHPPAYGTRVVNRGSNWYFHPPMCNSGARFAMEPTTRLESVGFRVVATVEAVKSAIHEPRSVEREDDGFALMFTEPGGVAIPTLRRDDPGPYTIELRLKLRRPGGVIVCIDGQAPCQIQPELEPGFIKGVERLVNGERMVRAPFPLDGRWRHVAYVQGDREVVLYVDGHAVARTPRPAPINPTPAPEANAGTNIGTQRYGDDLTYHTIIGSIDEVRFSRIARYEADFVPERRFTNDPDTVALYHCDEGEGSVLNDSSGNAHHGKILKTGWERIFTWRPPTGVSAEPAP